MVILYYCIHFLLTSIEFLVVLIIIDIYDSIECGGFVMIVEVPYYVYVSGGGGGVYVDGVVE